MHRRTHRTHFALCDHGLPMVSANRVLAAKRVLDPLSHQAMHSRRQPPQSAPSGHRYRRPESPTLLMLLGKNGRAPAACRLPWFPLTARCLRAWRRDIDVANLPARAERPRCQSTMSHRSIQAGGNDSGRNLRTLLRKIRIHVGLYCPQLFPGLEELLHLGCATILDRFSQLHKKRMR